MIWQMNIAPKPDTDKVTLTVHVSRCRHGRGCRCLLAVQVCKKIIIISILKQMSKKKTYERPGGHGGGDNRHIGRCRDGLLPRHVYSMSNPSISSKKQKKEEKKTYPRRNTSQSPVLLLLLLLLPWVSVVVRC